MEIVQSGNPVLRKIAEPVAPEEFGTPALKKLLADMAASLDPEEDQYSVGVALAAPQIGVSKRIFVVRYDRTKERVRDGEPERPADLGVFINPKIVKSSRRTVPMNEGCLSVRRQFGTVERYERTTVRAQDENGKTFERGGGGLLAQIFQHEIDHLDGTLFIDKAEDVYDIADETEHS